MKNSKQYCTANGLPVGHVVRQRARATREDYLLFWDDRHRATHVIIQEREGKQRTEFETYWLVLAAAEFARKKGWKHIWIKSNLYVHVTNPSGKRVGEWWNLGLEGTIIEREHWLNTSYYSPSGFWIENPKGK